MGGVIASFNGNGRHSLPRMLEKIRHRGISKKILFDNNKVQLGEVGFPGEKTDSHYSQGYEVVLDGSPIYNNRKIKRTDLISLYIYYGEDFLEKVEGQFAFILSNGDDFVAARDLFGVKPLYYGRSNGGVFFASELKALVSICEDVTYFPPGYVFTLKQGFQQFKELPSISPRFLNLEEAQVRLKEVVFSAVKKAMDTPCKKGIFLSGGVDSSIITAVATELSEQKVYTYSAGLEKSPDIQNARRMAGYAGTHHTEYIYSIQEIYEVLPQVVYYLESFDVEMINSSVANYFLSQLAKSDGVKIVFSGEGADELFGGYHFLKQFKDDEQKFTRKLQKLLKGLHNGGFQRVDRMAKAHALDVEMPYMDADVVKLALAVPGRWKITEEEMGKWLLRKSFTSYVPEEIIWRRKAQFGIGTGTESVMQDFIDNEIPDEEYYQARKEGDIDFKSKEEYYYYKLFKKFYRGSSAFKTVNRWLV